MLKLRVLLFSPTQRLTKNYLLLRRFKTLFLNKISGSCRELVLRKKLVGSGLSPQATLNGIYVLM